MDAKTHLIRDIRDVDRQLQLLLNDGFIPTLCIVFSYVSLSLKALADVFVAHQISVVGASSCGEIITDENVVRITDHAAVVMLLDVEPRAFKLYFLEGSDDNSYRLGMEAASLTQNHFEKQSLIVVASGMKVDG